MISSVKRVPRAVSYLLMLVITSVSVIAPLQADVVSTEDLYLQTEVDSMKSELKSFVARESVRDQLLDLGVQPGDVDQRIDALTDQEVLQMHESLDAMPAGEGLLGAVIGLLVIFMLLDIAGVTDIFPSI